MSPLSSLWLRSLRGSHLGQAFLSLSPWASLSLSLRGSHLWQAFLSLARARRPSEPRSSGRDGRKHARARRVDHRRRHEQLEVEEPHELDLELVEMRQRDAADRGPVVVVVALVVEQLGGDESGGEEHAVHVARAQVEPLRRLALQQMVD